MAPSGDVLSDVLRAIRLNGAVYFDYELSSPWVAEAPPSRVLAPLVMPQCERLIEYHVITAGSCWGRIVGGPPIRLRQGDIIAFPQGDAHVISSAPDLRAEPDMSAFVRRDGVLPLVFDAGGGGPERTHVVCGFLGCDERPFNPLLASLPPVIHHAAADHPSSGWLHSLVQTAVAESLRSRAGADNVLARVSELMFVEVVRRYLESLPAGAAGWLSGLRDGVVGKALAALHAAPGHDWTLESLAREIGVSRSVLAERFGAIVGQPPMQYLTNWRMQLASRRLLDGAPLSEVAAAAGYESDAAFSRSFKRVVGLSPAEWRRTRRS